MIDVIQEAIHAEAFLLPRRERAEQPQKHRERSGLECATTKQRVRVVPAHQMMGSSVRLWEAEHNVLELRRCTDDGTKCRIDGAQAV